MINGIFITIISIYVLILLSNLYLYKNREPMEIISKKKWNIHYYFNIVEKLLTKLKNKKYHNQFQEYDDVQRNKIWNRHIRGLRDRLEKKKDRRKDRRKDFIL